MAQELCQNANFQNWGTPIQIGIQHVLLNILSIYLMSRVQDTSDISICKSSSHVILRFEEK